MRLVGVEAAGAASLATGRPAVLHGARSSVLADEDGQVLDAHSISAGLDYPGVGPEHAFLRDTGRAEYVRVTDDEALDAFRARAHRGDHPGARVRARAGARRRAGRRAGARLSLPLGQGPRRGPRAVRRTLVVYLMCGRETPELAAAAVEAGADVVELGFPFSDPLADGPVIRRAAEQALADGMRTRECLDCLAQTRRRVDVPLIPMTYSSLLEAYGWERFEHDARDAGATSLIVADLPADARPSSGGPAGRADVDGRPHRRLQAAPTAGSTSSRWPGRPAPATPFASSRRTRRARPSGDGPALRGLRDLHAGARHRGGRARRRHRRRFGRTPGRRGRAWRSR